LFFPAATPSKLVYRYVENTTLNLIDVVVQTDSLLGKSYSISVVVSATQIFVSSNGNNTLYNATVEYYPSADAIGDDFNGAIWDVVLTDPDDRSNVVDYPMREGSGAVFYAYQDNASPYSSRDIPVPPPSRGTWGASRIPIWQGNNINVPIWTSAAATGFSISLDIGVSILSNVESLLMWNTNDTSLGLKVSSTNVSEYLYEHAGGIENVQILPIEIGKYYSINIQHLSNSVVVTTKEEGSDVTSVITSNITPSGIVNINYITGTAISATIWNVLLEDGSNSRYYPMQEGSGFTMLGYDQNGIATGSSGDASLVGSGVWITKNYLTSEGA